MSELVRVAILGTGQTAGPIPSSDTPADELVAKLALDASRDRERELLLRAGGAFVMRRAGVIAERWPDAEAIAEAPLEVRRRASAALGDMLRSMLLGEFGEILWEALTGMDRAGLRLPEELLPLALDQRGLPTRELLLGVLGERGRFLARDDGREAWSWAGSGALVGAVPDDADRRWEEATAIERERLFQLLRRTDPARARNWLAATFKSEKPEQRKRFIDALLPELGSEDAPFLETATRDRSQSVRVAAARVLWRLPQSDTARAVRAQAEACLNRSPTGELLVTLPAEPFGEGLETLGVLETPPAGVGPRQFWLAQLLSALPPGRVSEHLGLDAAQVVAAAKAHDLAQALLEGLSSALLRFGGEAWAAPLWDAWVEREGARSFLEPELLARLTERLPRDALEARLLACVRDLAHLEVFAAVPAPWPESVTHALLARFAQRTPGLAPLVHLAASRIPLSALPAELSFPRPPDTPRGSLDAAFEHLTLVIDFRRRLQKELSP